MQSWKAPKDNERYRWTQHVGRKMLYYGLSPSRVLRVVQAPERLEEGVAPGTLAGMQVAGSKQKPWEIWVMWRDDQRIQSPQQKSEIVGAAMPAPQARKIIITAWRYPGTSPVRGQVPIPADVMAELEGEGLLAD
jgi:hypothetical protein